MTGNHNIVAMPGSHVHVHSDPDLESEIPLAKAKWKRAATKAVGALMTLAGIARLIWHALH